MWIKCGHSIKIDAKEKEWMAQNKETKFHSLSFKNQKKFRRSTLNSKSLKSSLDFGQLGFVIFSDRLDFRHTVKANLNVVVGWAWQLFQGQEGILRFD